MYLCLLQKVFLKSMFCFYWLWVAASLINVDLCASVDLISSALLPAQVWLPYRVALQHCVSLLERFRASLLFHKRVYVSVSRP